MSLSPDSEPAHAYRSIWKYLFRVPHRLDWVDVDGVQTRFLEAGSRDRPTVIMIHGTAGSLENFAANIGFFSKHFHVLAVDMLGCGWTDKPDFPYTVRDYGKHIVGFMDALGVSHAAFIGVSLGSWVSVRLGVDYPGRVDALVGVAPTGIVVDQAALDQYIAGTKARRSAAATEPTWDSIRTIFSHLLLNERDIIDDLVGVRLEIYQDPATRANMANALNATKGEFRLSEQEWRSVPFPVLTIAAVDKDDIFLKNAYRIAELVPNGSVREMPGCDHWAQFEQADAFNGAVLEFLHKAASRSPTCD